MSDTVLLSILIPVQNESKSVNVVIKVLESLIEIPHEILIITEDSQESLVHTIHSLIKKSSNLKHVQNLSGKGVLNAVRTGVSAARGQYVMIYAADEIAPVLAIPQMVGLMQKGCDFVSGTRYTKGGKRYGGSKIGYFLSKSANSLFNLFTATALSDCTTGLKIFKRELFTQFDFTRTGSGWSFAFDMAIQAQLLKMRIGEVPIVSIDRLFGSESREKVIPWICSYIYCFIKGVRALPPWRSPKPQLNFQPHQP